jgi:hypothetical protein
MSQTIEIKPGGELATLINLFVVEPENQDELIAALEEGLEAFVSKQPGYIAAGLHKGMDGRHADRLFAVEKPAGRRGSPEES